MKKISKTDLVLRFMKEHGSITQMQAYSDCRFATRLGSIIYNLREQGYVIETEMCKGGDAISNYAKYILIETPQNAKVKQRNG